MKRLDFLADLAKLDERLVERNQAWGDELEQTRKIRFILLGNSRQQAEAVRAVVASCCHCHAFVSDDPGWSHAEELPGWRVVAWPDIPSTKPVLGSISALLAMLAREAGMRYCGWSAPLRTPYSFDIMRQVVARGWRALGAVERRDVQGQIELALPPDHVLYGIDLRVMFGRRDGGDFVCELPDKRVACIRFTKLSAAEPGEPEVAIHDSQQDWLDADRSDGPIP